MEYGTYNCKKWIDISELYSKLGPSICQSLPGFHALIGCDFNPSFSRREEENIIEESDGDENNDSEMSDDDEENEC
nr:unnamed protein product [Callosobruchus chinensis]